MRRVPARVQAARGPAGPVFRPRPPRRSDRAHQLWPVQRVLRRPRREEAAQPFPARVRRCCRSVLPAATSPASSVRTGTSPSRGRRIPWPTAPRPSTSPGWQPKWTAAVWLSRTTIRRSSGSTRPTSRTHATRRGIKAISVTAEYMCPSPRAEFYLHIDAANVDLKAFTEDFYHRVCVGHLRRRARHPRIPVPGNRRGGWRSPRCSFQGTTTATPKSPLECAWIKRARRRGMCHCISPRFIPTTRCWTSRRHRPRRWPRARRIGLAELLRFVYTGNVHDLDG